MEVGKLRRSIRDIKSKLWVQWALVLWFALCGNSTAAAVGDRIVVTVRPPVESGMELQQFYFDLPAGESFGLVYRHSVEQTLVEEWILVDEQSRLVMQEMRYRSFGAGLPYGSEQGHWQRQDDVFVWRDIGIILGEFSLLLSSENAYELHLPPEAYYLQWLPPATQLHFAVKQSVKEVASIGQFFGQKIHAGN